MKCYNIIIIVIRIFNTTEENVFPIGSLHYNLACFRCCCLCVCCIYPKCFEDVCVCVCESVLYDNMLRWSMRILLLCVRGWMDDVNDAVAAIFCCCCHWCCRHCRLGPYLLSLVIFPYKRTFLKQCPSIICSNVTNDTTQETSNETKQKKKNTKINNNNCFWTNPTQPILKKRNTIDPLLCEKN